MDEDEANKDMLKFEEEEYEKLRQMNIKSAVKILQTNKFQDIVDEIVEHY